VTSPSNAQTKAVRVVLTGANGRMGREAIKALAAAHDITLVAAVSRSGHGQPLAEIAPTIAGIENLTLESDLDAVLGRTQTDVLLDLSHHAVAEANALAALAQGASPVLGATGLGPEALARIDAAAREAGIGAIYVPNFAVGAVLMMRFAEMAARWLPDVEIVEMHHDRKADAPSGTALRTAEIIAAARTRPPTAKPEATVKAAGALGGRWPEGAEHPVPIHSVRLPGLLAHQMVLFGGPGETLTLRHDSLDRAGFMEGVKLAVRRVRELEGLVIGLEALLF
jgi:4-hydroxy-tetrahydrodipicolinate reductase